MLSAPRSEMCRLETEALIPEAGCAGGREGDAFQFGARLAAGISFLGAAVGRSAKCLEGGNGCFEDRLAVFRYLSERTFIAAETRFWLCLRPQAQLSLCESFRLVDLEGRRRGGRGDFRVEEEEAAEGDDRCASDGDVFRPKGLLVRHLEGTSTAPEDAAAVGCDEETTTKAPSPWRGAEERPRYQPTRAPSPKKATRGGAQCHSRSHIFGVDETPEDAARAFDDLRREACALLTFMRDQELQLDGDDDDDEDDEDDEVDDEVDVVALRKAAMAVDELRSIKRRPAARQASSQESGKILGMQQPIAAAEKVLEASRRPREKGLTSAQEALGPMEKSDLRLDDGDCARKDFFLMLPEAALNASFASEASLRPREVLTLRSRGLGFLCGHVIVREFRSGEVLIDEGVAPFFVFVTVDGTVAIEKSANPCEPRADEAASRLSRRDAKQPLSGGPPKKKQVLQRRLADLVAPVILGDVSSLLCDVDEPYRCVAVSDTVRVLAVPADRFEELLDLHSDERLALTKNAKLRLAWLEKERGCLEKERGPVSSFEKKGPRRGENEEEESTTPLGLESFSWKLWSSGAVSSRQPAFLDSWPDEATSTDVPRSFYAGAVLCDREVAWLATDSLQEKEATPADSRIRAALAVATTGAVGSFAGGEADAIRRGPSTGQKRPRKRLFGGPRRVAIYRARREAARLQGRMMRPTVTTTTGKNSPPEEVGRLPNYDLALELAKSRPYLMLFPTATRDRRLHSKMLPLVPKLDDRFLPLPNKSQKNGDGTPGEKKETHSAEHRGGGHEPSHVFLATPAALRSVTAAGVARQRAQTAPGQLRDPRSHLRSDIRRLRSAARDDDDDDDDDARKDDDGPRRRAVDRSASTSLTALLSGTREGAVTTPSSRTRSTGARLQAGAKRLVGLDIEPRDKEHIRRCVRQALRGLDTIDPTADAENYARRRSAAAPATRDRPTTRRRAAAGKNHGPDDPPYSDTNPLPSRALTRLRSTRSAADYRRRHYADMHSVVPGDCDITGNGLLTGATCLRPAPAP